MSLRLERRGKIKRMNRSAILGQPQVAEVFMAAEEGDDFGAARAEGFGRLTVGKNNGLGLSRHLSDGAVIFWSDGIRHFQKSVFICGPVGMDIANDLPAIAPGSGEGSRPAERRITIVETGHAGVHQQPEDEWLGRVPDFPEFISVSLTLGKDGRHGGVGGPGGTDFSSGVVLGLGFFAQRIGFFSRQDRAKFRGETIIDSTPK